MCRRLPRPSPPRPAHLGLTAPPCEGPATLLAPPPHCLALQQQPEPPLSYTAHAPNLALTAPPLQARGGGEAPGCRRGSGISMQVRWGRSPPWVVDIVGWQGAGGCGHTGPDLPHPCPSAHPRWRRRWNIREGRRRRHWTGAAGHLHARSSFFKGPG